MLDAKISLKMSEEGFAAWLAAFELSRDRLGQCLELGQAALDRRKAEATERVESLGRMVKESTKPNEPRNVAGL
jgi:hypothetical protein